MRPTPWLHVEPFRIAGAPGSGSGAFKIPSKAMVPLRVIASSGMEWEHVSVSLQNRCPIWEEMHFVKGIFWLPDETVMQLHPAERNYINRCEFCLHLWRPIGREIPTPPIILV